MARVFEGGCAQPGAATFALLLLFDRDDPDEHELITDNRSGACSVAAAIAGATGGFSGAAATIGCPA